MFEEFFKWAWAGYIAAAGLLALSRRGNALLVLGLLGMSSGSLRYAMVRWEVIDAAELAGYQEPLQLLSVASVCALLLGVVWLALGQRGAAGSSSSSGSGSEENVATLIVPRAANNSYARAEALRDAACNRMVEKIAGDRLEFIVQKSNVGDASVWFRVDYILPDKDPSLSLRALVAVTVERLDFHRFENLFTVQTRVGTEVGKVQGLIAFDDDAVARIHRHITVAGTRLKLPNRIRQHSWQIWRPANKIARLRGDWAMKAAVAGAVACVLVPVIGPLLILVAFGAIYFWTRNRRTYTLTTARPLSEPRRLHWMDSWQVTVSGLAAAKAALAEQLDKRILAGAPADLALDVERVAYWGIDGQVQRDQILVRYRRSLGFIHIVPYGENLYVGWECHLNTAAWKEEAVARGVDRSSGRLVHANRLVAGVHGLNEYDVADANFLSEWLHEAVKRELQLKLAEYKIDQEIDFTIQRESRKDALQADDSQAPKAKKESRSRLVRTA